VHRRAKQWLAIDVLFADAVLDRSIATFVAKFIEDLAVFFASISANGAAFRRPPLEPIGIGAKTACRKQCDACVSETAPHNQKHPWMINACARDYDSCLRGSK
jgi:hypothetical protein